MSAIRGATGLSFPFTTQDPFLFAVHHLDFYPPGKADMSIGASTRGRNLGMDFGNKDWNMYHGRKVPGFPQHPHRGFETITFTRRGMTDHSDSMGCKGRFGDGDTQWMTAGTGVSHCEMFPQLHTDKPNTLELFQIWLNLPIKNKHVQPAFKMLWAEDLVVYNYGDDSTGRARVTTVAGTLPEGTPVPEGDAIRAPPSPPPDSWAADPDNHVAVWSVSLEAGASWDLPPAPKEVTRSLFFVQGAEAVVDGRRFKQHANLQLRPDAKVRLSNPAKLGSDAETVEFLLLQGRPIDEPVVKHGPFVMESAEAIQQAFMDYRSGKFGRWPWDSDAPVHPKGKGRFAMYADGTEERPPAKDAAAGKKAASTEATTGSAGGAAGDGTAGAGGAGAGAGAAGAGAGGARAGAGAGEL